jgi:predicted MFS family arabinose efflux permease
MPGFVWVSSSTWRLAVRGSVLTNNGHLCLDWADQGLGLCCESSPQRGPPNARAERGAYARRGIVNQGLTPYLRPFLEQVTHGDVATLSLLLLAMGVTGLIGTVLSGALLQRSVRRVLVVIPVLMSGIAMALTVANGSLTAVALLLATWGLLGTPAPVDWGTWLTRALPADAEAGGGLMVATIRFAITLGASAGGIVFDGYGYQATFGLSSGVLAIGALLAYLAGARVE